MDSQPVKDNGASSWGGNRPGGSSDALTNSSSSTAVGGHLDDLRKAPINHEYYSQVHNFRDNSGGPYSSLPSPYGYPYGGPPQPPPQYPPPFYGSYLMNPPPPRPMGTGYGQHPTGGGSSSMSGGPPREPGAMFGSFNPSPPGYPAPYDFSNHHAHPMGYYGMNPMMGNPYAHMMMEESMRNLYASQMPSTAGGESKGPPSPLLQGQNHNPSTHDVNHEVLETMAAPPATVTSFGTGVTESSSDGGAGAAPSATTSRPAKPKSNENRKKVHTCPMDACDYSTYRASNMKAHIRHHNADRPYKCTFPGCKYSASQLSNLKVHENIHTGDRPYKCDVKGCVYAAAHKNILNSHKRRMHKEEFGFLTDDGRPTSPANMSNTVSGAAALIALTAPSESDGNGESEINDALSSEAPIPE